MVLETRFRVSFFFFYFVQKYNFFQFLEHIFVQKSIILSKNCSQNVLNYIINCLQSQDLWSLHLEQDEQQQNSHPLQPQNVNLNSNNNNTDTVSSGSQNELNSAQEKESATGYHGNHNNNQTLKTTNTRVDIPDPRTSNTQSTMAQPLLGIRSGMASPRASGIQIFFCNFKFFDKFLISIFFFCKFRV